METWEVRVPQNHMLIDPSARRKFDHAPPQFAYVFHKICGHPPQKNHALPQIECKLDHVPSHICGARDVKRLPPPRPLVQHGRFSAPKLTNLYREPCKSTCVYPLSGKGIHSLRVGPLLSKVGTYKTDRSRIWPWFSIYRLLPRVPWYHMVINPFQPDSVSPFGTLGSFSLQSWRICIAKPASST